MASRMVSSAAQACCVCLVCMVCIGTTTYAISVPDTDSVSRCFQDYDGYRDLMMCVLYTGSHDLSIIGEIQVCAYVRTRRLECMYALSCVRLLTPSIRWLTSQLRLLTPRVLCVQIHDQRLHALKLRMHKLYKVKRATKAAMILT